jgi:hypothetical protein
LESVPDLMSSKIVLFSGIRKTRTNPQPKDSSSFLGCSMKIILCTLLKTARHSWVAVWKLYSALSWNYHRNYTLGKMLWQVGRTTENATSSTFWKSIFRSFTCFSLLKREGKKKLLI